MSSPCRQSLAAPGCFFSLFYPELWYDWALDTYRFACEKWGEENVIGFDVHCDETSIHAHVQTVPVEQVKKRGRIGSKYIHKDNPEKVLSTKEWRAFRKRKKKGWGDKRTEKW